MERTCGISMIAVAALLLVPLPARAAQDPAPAPAQTPAQTQTPQAAQALERLEQLEARLSLTPEQKEQLRPVLVDELQQMKALREKSQAGGGSRRDRRKLAREFRDIQGDTDKKLRAILNESQMAEMKKIREEWRQQIRERAQAR